VCWLRPIAAVVDDEARLRFRHDAHKLSERCGVRVFTGCELSVGLDGALALPDAVRAELDVVVADCALPPNTLPKGEATARALSVVASGLVDGLSHLTGRELLVHDGNELDVRVVLMACARQKVFVEVSGEPDRLDLDHRSCRVARDLGTMLSITARAADVPELDRRRFGVWQARRGWISPLTVLNAWPVVDAERFFCRGGRLPLPALSTVEDDEVAPAAPELLAVPLAPDVRARIEAFLVGGDDDELRVALERRGGNALSAAFALLATDDATS
jgi:DNA polymerase (family 10)